MSRLVSDNSKYQYEHKLNCFLDQARSTLASKELTLLTEVINEWHAASSLNELLVNWKKYHTLLQTLLQQQLFSYIYLLCFNVRGLELRWGEVCLLVQKHHSGILVLGEVGQVDLSLVGAALANYNVFYQAGDNPHEDVLVLTRKDIIVTRVTCSLPNVCVIDIFLSESIRMIAIYAPASKTWNWTDLTPFITSRCMIMGDFNVDIEPDGDKADRLLEWMDSGSLWPVVPDTNTSLRSDRIIDYAVTINVDLSIQTYEGITSSDHKPLLGVFTDEDLPKHEGSRTIWSVFSLFLAYTYDYWEKRNGTLNLPKIRMNSSSRFSRCLAIDVNIIFH